MDKHLFPRHLARRVLLEAGGLLAALIVFAAFVYVVDALLF